MTMNSDEENAKLANNNPLETSGHGSLVPLQGGGQTPLDAMGGDEDDDPINIFTDTSLTDLLFDNDINLDEPLGLISSVGPEASILDDSWRQDPKDGFHFPANSQPIRIKDIPKIATPHENDVLLGRGGRNNQWSGNEMLRTLAKGMSDRYAQAHKRDKPGLAWVLVTQMRQLNPPARFLKHMNGSGDWYEVSDDVAKEKASQCLRDIVAAQKVGGGSSRKRAFASAPELATVKRQRQDLTGGQNATFDTSQFHTSSSLVGTNPLLSMLANSSQGRPGLPPKAISCMSLGNAQRSGMSPLTSMGSTAVHHQDPLLRQLQMLRAQQNNGSFSKGNAMFPQQPALISQPSLMAQPQPSMNFERANHGNATWDIQSLQQKPPPSSSQEPVPYVSAPTKGEQTVDDSALKRWIDRLAQEEP